MAGEVAATAACGEVQSPAVAVVAVIAAAVCRKLRREFCGLSSFATAKFKGDKRACDAGEWVMKADAEVTNKTTVYA